MLVFSRISGQSSHALYSLERRKGYMCEHMKTKAISPDWKTVVSPKGHDGAAEEMPWEGAAMNSCQPSDNAVLERRA